MTTFSTMLRRLCPPRRSTTVAAVVAAVLLVVLQPRMAKAEAPVADLSMRWQSGATVAITGWAYDPDTPSAVVHPRVYVDGLYVGSRPAMDPAGDYPAPPGVPGDHGFSITFTAQHAGPTEICLKISDTDGSGATSTSCTTIAVAEFTGAGSPHGQVKMSGTTSSSPTYPTVSINGYAYDHDDLASPVVVVLVIDGEWVQYSYANQTLPPYAPEGTPQGHGFWLFPVITKPGSHQVCVYMINAGAGANQFAGCETVVWNAVLPQVRGDMGGYAAGSAIITKGWAFDELFMRETMRIMLTLDGEVKAFFFANQPSPELYPYGIGGDRGFVAGFHAPPGKHQVCQFVVSTQGRSALTRCIDVVTT